jgi:xanthosine utilization system XapX-like protein
MIRDRSRYEIALLVILGIFAGEFLPSIAPSLADEPATVVELLRRETENRMKTGRSGRSNINVDILPQENDQKYIVDMLSQNTDSRIITGAQPVICRYPLIKTLFEWKCKF